MESFLVQLVLQELKKDGINIKPYSHDDDDGVTRNLMQEYFPEAKEYLDIGHSAKNLKKKVIAAGKDFPEMRGFGERTQRDFQTLVKNHHTNPEVIL